MLAAAALLLASCRPENLNPEQLGGQDDCVFSAGDPVIFDAVAPMLSGSKAGVGDFEESGYHFVKGNYDFNISMLQQTDEEGSFKILGTAIYAYPSESTDPYGALELNDEVNAPHLWYDLNTKYAFKAQAGYGALQTDQKSLKAFLDQDKMTGFAGYPGINHNEPCFMTAREWYAKNKEIVGATSNKDFYKRIPLYVNHERAKISVILKAGEGVNRLDLKNAGISDESAINSKIETHIYSYTTTPSQKAISPFLTAADVDYGTQEHPDVQPSACYEAIVEPYDYLTGTNATNKKISDINLSGLKFNFYAANDKRYAEWERETDAELKSALWTQLQDCYILTPGKHLVIEVTLSTATRKVLITAYVTDWEERVFSTICDDNGQSGKPEIIEDQAQLEAFLADPQKNAPGKVAYIGPGILPIDGTWVTEGKVLRATLNGATATFTCVNPLFESIEGQFKNANVVIGKVDGSKNPVADVVEYVVARTNTGTIERVNVSPANNMASATRAGLVTTNYGTIYKCGSAIPVKYTGTASAENKVFVGGIAAESYDLYDSEGVFKSFARIEDCTVTARVDKNVAESAFEFVYGGGIVGCAEGYVTGNRFEYGITLNQDQIRFLNIVSEVAPSTEHDELQASDNSWPTMVTNPRAGDNANTTALYNHVLDCAAELKLLVNGSASATLNKIGYRYRVSDSFTVRTDDWKTEGGSMIGTRNDNREIGTTGNVFFELDGNNKSITISKGTEESAPMLFTNVMGSIHDLTLLCANPLISHKGDTEEEKDVVTAIAPLAYSVSKVTVDPGEGGSSVKSDGRLSNITVREQGAKDVNVYVEAMAPSGLVVWAYDDAVVENCMSDVEVKVWTVGTAGQAVYFAGGIVNSVCDASIIQCMYLRTSLSADIVNNVFYGGIVGGANRISESHVEPSVFIGDCASRLVWESDRAWGSIIGRAVYDVSAQQYNAMAEGNSGNWWDGAEHVLPVGAKLPTMSYEQVIGKKNSVVPDWPNFSK